MLGNRYSKKPRSKDEGEKPFWISFADLMTALMTLFLVVMAVSLMVVTKKINEATQAENQRSSEILDICTSIQNDAALKNKIIAVDCKMGLDENSLMRHADLASLRDITEAAGQVYNASAVGEVNVVKLMKSTSAVIGGEGNGGIIYPKLHFGRDALVGIALFLTHLAKSGLKISELRASYPEYFISKNKIS